jgi:DNA polymerase-3 subunit delta'
MGWNAVIGQERVKGILRRAIGEHRVPHAYLFWGPPGTGKDALAIELARTLLCESGQTDGCGLCSSCKRMASLQHPNLRFVVALPASKTDNNTGEVKENITSDVVDAIRTEMAAKAADPYHQITIPRAAFITVNAIREIRRESSMSSFEAGKKIFIISEAEKMNASASNALLKILEEPPAETLFFLTTTRIDQLLPTIISRCQSIRCELLQDDEIARALIERINVPADRARVAARLSNGDFRRACELLSDEVAQEREDAIQFLRDTMTGNIAGILQPIEKEWKDMDRSAVEEILSLLLIWFRDALLISEGFGDGIISSDQRTALERFAARYGKADLAEAMQATERALELVRRNVYLPLIFISLSIQIKRILLHVRNT